MSDDEDDSGVPYGNFHKALYSVFWQYKVLENSYLQKVHKALTEKFKVQTTVDSAVRCINQKMEAFSFEIRKGRNRETGRIYWVLVNALGDKVSEETTTLPQSHLEYFKEILNKFSTHYAEHNERTLSDTEIINLGQNVKLKPKEAEGLLAKFIEDLWLEKIARGRIGIGVRTFLERKQDFQEGGTYDGFDTGFQ